MVRQLISKVETAAFSRTTQFLAGQRNMNQSEQPTNVRHIVVAAAFTAQEFETGTLQILRAVTAMTWPVFFNEVMSFADAIYALVGAVVAAFYANRKLTRAEYFALRLWKQEQGQ